ncbi:hypothetical protein PoB_003071700 [Plakobranchus ocellatus]|uniref:Uncharacterized protein n=1 Tax=Plakobranchus ocellatus TaxID=259542 RepID=A0AAV4ABF4_9GAST|nr:hypothetical protein PoB_003071700 [Plakobranchus ocellatus]
MQSVQPARSRQPTLIKGCSSKSGNFNPDRFKQKVRKAFKVADPQRVKVDSIVATWRQFRDYPLPCVGQTEVARGFKPSSSHHFQINENFSSLTLDRDIGCLKRTITSVSEDKKDKVEDITTPESEDNQHTSQSLSIKETSVCYHQSESCHNTSNSHLPKSLMTKAQAHKQNTCALVPEESPKSHTLPGVSKTSQGGKKATIFKKPNVYPVLMSAHAASQPSTMSGPATYTPPMSPLCGRVMAISDNVPSSPLPGHLGSSASLFSISSHDAAQLVRLVKNQPHDSRHCYFIHLKLRTLYSDEAIPGASIRKLPRLLNGIPLGAGFLSRDQVSEIRWRLVEGDWSTLTFLSCPLLRDEAEESRSLFRDRLVTQAQAVFGDITVRASITLSKCIDYHDDLVLNDIATNVGDGLQFKD